MLQYDKMQYMVAKNDYMQLEAISGMLVAFIVLIKHKNKYIKST